MTERTITLHHDGLGNEERLKIMSDERDPSCGNATHWYGFAVKIGIGDTTKVGELHFQKGSRNESDHIPGVTSAGVLAMLIDHYESFQSGPFMCAENEQILRHLRAALKLQHDRARRVHDDGGEVQQDQLAALHPATAHVLWFFRYEHLPPMLQVVSKQFHDLATSVALRAPSNPETTVALRKLLEAKDAAVRAAMK